MDLTRFEVFETWLKLHNPPFYATKHRGGPPNPVVYQVKSELESFFHLLEAEPTHECAFEVGLARGATHYLWRTLYNHVISVERSPFLVGLFCGEQSVRGFPLGKTSGFVIGTSTDPETMSQLKGDLPQEADFCFIDGGHSYDDVKGDHLLYAPLVKEGGIVGFHDVISRETGVPRYMEELKGEGYPLQFIIDSEDTGIAWYRKGVKG